MPNRHIERDTGLAEQILHGFEQGRVVDVVGVHLRDDDHPAQALLAGLVEHAAGVHTQTGVGVDHDGRRVDGLHRPQHLGDEIGIAGRVDQIEVLASVIEMHQRRLQRVLVDLLFVVKIADARPIGDACRTFDRSGARQDGISQRGLSGRSMATKHYVANILDLAWGHAGFPLVIGSLSCRCAPPRAPAHRSVSDYLDTKLAQ